MKKTIIIIACLLAALQLPAQPKLGKTVSVSRPRVLDGQIIKEKEAYSVLKAPYGQDQIRDGRGSFWEVFSDRRDNPVYSAPDGRKVISTLDIGDKLRIAEINSGYALVYTDSKNRFPEISSAAKSVGWVPLDKLLLWQKVLSDDIGISMKAVICADLDQKGKLKTVDGRKRYFSPTGDDGFSLQSDMHFYYVFKREGDRVLLGRRDEINNDVDLYYWVNEGTYVPWNSRTCLEPTWELEDVEYFAARKYQWQIFTTPDLKGLAPAGDVFTLEPRERTEKRSDYFVREYTYRKMPVTYLRYPILEGSTKTAFHCTTFGTIGDSKGTVKGMARTADADHEKAARTLDERRKLNIVIVIDGTRSMRPYFDAVRDALNELNDYFVDTKVNVGVMIYRDKDDREYATECFPEGSGFVRPDNPSLRKWLDAGGKYTLKSVSKDNRESLYNGIDKAIDRFFPESVSKNSNIMLVIGDCGDNGKFKQITRTSLGDKLAARDVTLMGFQVVNKDNDDYNLFNNQITGLMSYTIRKRYAQASEVALSIKPRTREGGKIVEMRIAEENFKENFYIGLHCSNPKANEQMSKEVLTSSIESVLAEWQASVDYLVRQTGNTADYGTQESIEEENIEGTRLREDIIKYMLGDDELFERFKQRRSLMAFRGYAKRKQDGRDLFKVIVFFPARELESLVFMLDNVYQVAKAQIDNQGANRRDVDRRPYYDAMMKLARLVVAQDKISSTSYNEILAKVFGLENENKNGLTLDDIVDPGTVSNDDYFKILRKMNNSVLRLKAVTAGDYPFILTYSGNNDKYYWLPSEYLPLIDSD